MTTTQSGAPATERYREILKTSRRWVIKVGSSLVTNQGQGLDEARITNWVEQIAELRRGGVVEIVLVSSGAVAAGMSRLGWSQRPTETFRLQAAAAVGQMILVQAYETQFQRFGLHAAQILLTHEDLADRKRYLNARRTMQELVTLNVVPVVNENDTVAVDEIRLGDNDTLAALVANLLSADVLVILTDQHGMYDQDPSKVPNAKLLTVVAAGNGEAERMAAGGGVGRLGRGGMLTKVRAAARAASSGAVTVVASGRENDTLLRLRAGESVGTLFYPEREPLAARKQWLAARLQVRGTVWLDAGAAKVLRESGSSLLPVGVTRVQGDFQRGDLVTCVGPNGLDVARGLVNYSAEEASKILGQPTDQIVRILGYVDEAELIHRDNLVLM